MTARQRTPGPERENDVGGGFTLCPGSDSHGMSCYPLARSHLTLPQPSRSAPHGRHRPDRESFAGRLSSAAGSAAVAGHGDQAGH